MAKIPISRGLAYHLFCEPTGVKPKGQRSSVGLFVGRSKDRSLRQLLHGLPV